MPYRFSLTGDIKSVSSAFAQVVGNVQTASNWSMSWPGTGGDSRDALIEAGECSSTTDTENAVRAIASSVGVAFRPGRL